MQQYQFDFNSKQGGSPFSGIGCLVTGLLVAVATYFIIKGLYKILYYASPVLLIAALVINWRVVAGIGQSLLNLLTRNPIAGLLVGALAVVAFPFTAAFIFMSALGARRVEKLVAEMQQRQQNFEKQVSGDAAQDGEYVDFEEVKEADEVKKRLGKD